jgi:predicted nuclease of predicted toxin-antitoxin system
MPLKVMVDEDLPRQAVQLLREYGYDAVSVVEQGMSGWKDPPLWIAIQKDERYLMTADKGFGDIRVYPPGTHQGILLLRPDEDGIRPVVDLLQIVIRLGSSDVSPPGTAARAIEISNDRTDLGYLGAMAIAPASWR